MIKLIASDMDGTLLDSKMGISKDNATAIREAERLGIEFMVATGRAYTEAKPALDDAGIECAMITLNGAKVFDKAGNSLFTAGIDKKTTTEILDILDTHDVYFEVSTNKGIYSERQEKRIENFAAHIATTMPHLTYKVAIAMAAAHLSLLDITYIEDMRTLIQQPDIEVLKIIGFSMDGPKVLAPASTEIRQLNDLVVTSSAQNNIEVNHKNAQKGIAVAHVAKERGISEEEVMTIGDNFNDVSMLQWAGVSFAMGNAELEVKDHAKYITSTNLENGVGEAILRAIREDL
ncbi:Cof-type HAD-IIB family hydrolase [Enterococcus caccae]|uniref:Cof-like hydrolase n=1 Tax=Enterococcus caccae ATCC BAA-1240 TaxID=1158612 RepID=R3U1L2_9ENTE|nr:Cof-type HAD-IIB family hydrolase [Enterococcus caccae]EOL47794.1 cof-like hydrolase [Enterococcus caccae ATCC BAA-1240]EOT65592.1 HAD superfamily hydrolase [Enterococcus caccae ATCC BAA-1240]OJG27224.1 cof-like hydrolase [Enterococcus caccae]